MSGHISTKGRIVLRVDPIVPTPDGLAAADLVLRTATDMGLLPSLRVRVSVFDQYKHVVARFKTAGIELPYPEGNFYASPAQFRQVSDLLASYPDIVFETCAEKALRGPNIVRMGCVSPKDLELMGLPTPERRLCLGLQDRAARPQASVQKRVQILLLARAAVEICRPARYDFIIIM